MNKNINKNIFTAIDIGTTKICTIIAKKENGKIEVLGIGIAPSKGLEKGVVVNIDATVRSIKQSLAEAQTNANITISEAYVGITGSHIQSFNSSGSIALKKNFISSYDIDTVISAAQAVPIEKGQKIIHVIPQYFVIDHKEIVTNPLHLYGSHLSTVVHIISGSLASIQNIIKCCTLSGVTVKDVVLEQIASAKSVLTLDESKFGVGILDIGGGTSDFALYLQNSIRFTKVLPIAGNLFTKDLAIGLHTSIEEAETVKQKYGISNVVLLEEEYENSSFNKKNSSFDSYDTSDSHAISYILQSRTEELFLLLKNEIEKNKLSSLLTYGIVITGGGSLLKNIEHVAKNILHLPVRKGVPKKDLNAPNILQNPMYATAYGLILYAIENRNKKALIKDDSLFEQISQKVKTWFYDLF